MKPIVKFQGGKSKEIPIIKNYIPQGIKRIIEPFCGGAAVSFEFEIPAILYDINENVINLYQVVSNDDLYPKLQCEVDKIKTYDRDQLEPLYYHSRDVINQKEKDPYSKALAYIVVRQLCFSGMERYNSSGEFNVPFGHYKKFSCNLSPEHNRFLKTCIIKNASALDCFDEVKDGDFVFIDPPYLDRLGYTCGDGGIQLHSQLVEKVKQCKSNWLIVHCDDEFYRNEYKDYSIDTAEFNYKQRWGKNKNHENSKVNHLYISNTKIKTQFELLYE